jgi:multicomponent Na+:H+ antiporter subunit A
MPELPETDATPGALMTLLAAHLLAALLIPFLARRLGRRVFFVAALPLAATAGWAAFQAPDILAGRPVVEGLAWAPDLGFDLRLRLDAFGLLMVALVSGIGTLIFVYSRWYFGDQPGLGRLASLLTGFAGAMLGLVVTDNLFALFLFWELTSVTSYLLIGFDDRSAAARAAAMRALLVTAAGGLAMFGGFVLLAEGAGTYSLSAILADPPRGALIEVALVLVLLGAFTKSAQAPFHFWLPGAMAAPTPVSAYLHSATMVKAGVYLIARLAPAFADAGFWRPLVIGVGLATLLIGGWRAVAQRDLKLLLAHGTTSQLGLMVVLLGAGFEQATLAGATLLLAHGAFKAALFMVVGIVDHQAHTRDLRRLSGLHRSLRPTFVVAVLAVASMAGLPPLLGFVAKEAAYEAFVHADIGPWRALVLLGLVLGSAFTFAYSARFLWGAFAAKRPEDLDPDGVVASVKPPYTGFLAPAALLAVVTLVAGLMPQLVSSLAIGAAQALDARVPAYPLALWHGFNQALALSATTVLGGLGLWSARRRLGRLQENLHLLPDGVRTHDHAVKGVLRLADRVTGSLQTGSLPMYLVVILATVLVVPGTILVSQVGLPTELLIVDRPLQLAVFGLLVVATIAALYARGRLAAVLAVGAVGYGVAVLFLIQGAPDLALTQLLIETLLLVLFVLVLRHLPAAFAPRSDATWEVPRAVIATGIGIFTAMLAMAAAAARRTEPLSDEYLARALPEAGGRNVVNVILVDFRAFDTLGEIVVLAVAALGVIGLVRAARREREARGGGRAVVDYRPSMILDTAVRTLFHTVLIFSLVLLALGHDAPGGGFIGGLVAGAAFILVYLAGGTPAVRRAEPLAAEALLGAGITLATLSGVAGWLTGGEFLEGLVYAAELPLVGPLRVYSTLFFDVGVYLVVVGLVMALLGSIGREEVQAS